MPLTPRQFARLVYRLEGVLKGIPFIAMHQALYDTLGLTEKGAFFAEAYEELLSIDPDQTAHAYRTLSIAQAAG